MMDKMREWTNEEQIEFLNSIEASFVRAMFPDGGVNTGQQQQQHSSSQIDCLLHLDRVLPDSCDSTEDLPTQRHGSLNTSPPAPESNRSRVVRKTRRLTRSQPYAHLQEQVVPQAVMRRRE